MRTIKTTSGPIPRPAGLIKIRCLFVVFCLGCLGYLPLLHAESIATITAFETEVWIHRGDSKERLGLDSEIRFGDRIVTSAGGRVDAALTPDTNLILNSNSEIEMHAGTAAEPGDLPELYIHRGSACVTFRAGADQEDQLKLNVGNSLFAVIQYQGHICALRQKSISSISLREGSVQVTQTVDPNMIIISELGTEFRVDDDDGGYQLLFPGSDDSLTQYDETPVITAVDTVVESQAELEGSSTAATQPTSADTAEPTVGKPASDSIYTVYLFSTRSEEIAARVNNRFLAAGYETFVIASEKESVTRYRVAVSGFDSRQSAQDFADSIVGNHGISDTWIGKDRKTKAAE